MSEPDVMPASPGFYAHDPHMGWIKFENYADMMFFRVQQDPPCVVRVVRDPAEEVTVV